MFWLIVALLIILDQAVKFFVVASMELGHSVPVLPGIFHHMGRGRPVH